MTRRPKSIYQRQSFRPVRIAGSDDLKTDVLIDVARHPMRRRHHSVPAGRYIQELLAEGMIRVKHVHPGLSSFEDHYALTAKGAAELKRHRRNLITMVRRYR